MSFRFKRDKADENRSSTSSSVPAPVKSATNIQPDSSRDSGQAGPVGAEAGSAASVKSGVVGQSPEKKLASIAPQTETTPSILPSAASPGGIAGVGIASQVNSDAPAPTSSLPPPGTATSAIPVASQKQTSYSPIHRQAPVSTTATITAPTTQQTQGSSATIAPAAATPKDNTAREATLGVAGLTGGAFLGDTALTSIGTGPSETSEPISTTSRATITGSGDSAAGTALPGGTYVSIP
ncbi:hypothetical protein EJ05DRAFT_47809 [Pseudovirgaria hyperparasitica]|uniref:Uncharacterized protein n=1 Tax=Pseudovirgaria hyperparasitica TaxID=470096 RepID=A0A6A6W5U1_9PEZI|nr:uncharacterized protein EJ05DRAFT_47809 [Pseudovirgaria hyperparasitica]KAF2756917.1 hypothetical protein EJ05DRAFT_47809 [Pseudovirgaria hyperparasitica]